MFSINILGLSFHSVLLLNFLENLSASILRFPRMWAVEMKDLLLKHHNHISFAIPLHFLDLIIPLLLIYATAVELSDIIFWYAYCFYYDNMWESL